MADIARLDFTRAPPGYTDWKPLPSGRPVDDRMAWTRHKTEHDPPGVEQWYVAFADGCRVIVSRGDRDHPDARRARRLGTWPWYERRHKLVADLEAEGVQIDMWPWALWFSNDNCSACEEWLKRGPAWSPDDFPSVLRRLALYVDKELAQLDDDGRWWPAILTWSNEQVAEVERWLAALVRPAETPEVLRGR